jgi:hypothetical protein
MLFALFQPYRLRAHYLDFVLQSQKECLDGAPTNQAFESCSDEARFRIEAEFAHSAVEDAYGKPRQWWWSIPLVCLGPPIMIYALIRFLIWGGVRLFRWLYHGFQPA